MLFAVHVLSDGEPVSGPAELRALLPLGLLLLVAVGANLLLIVLVCFVVLRTLLHRRLRDLARTVTAAVSAYALASLINALLAALLGSRQVLDTLTGTPADVFTNATLGYVAAAIAFTRTMPSGQPRIRALLWTGITLVAACALLALVTSALALVMTVLVGLVCAALARYAVGAGPAPRADGRIHAEMHRFGMTTTDIRPAGTDDEGNPRHVADLDDGTRVEVAVMNSENTTGFWQRLRDLLLLRGPVAPRMLYGVRRRAEHAALMSFSAREAGVTVPRVRAVGEVGPGTVLLARELLPLRTLDTLEEADLTDDLLDRCWSVLGTLHHRRIAHGNLNPTTVGVLDDGSGTVALTGVDRGAVAAPQLTISLDDAAMMTLLALRVGPERAVDSAVRALGVSAAARVLPLLQPAGLPYPLRARLRSRSDLLSDLRARIVEVAPEAPAAPARLERMRPRTIVSVIVATVVGLVLAYQLAGVDLRGIGDADPGWTAAAFGMATLCMIAAAMVLIGFAPVPLPWWRTVMVQYAASFVRIAAPAGLGSIAINSRFVVKAGAPAPLALSAVGLTQLVGFLVHVPLLLVCAYLTGTSYWTGFTPSPTVVGVSIAGTAVVAAILLLPGLRRRVVERVGPYLRGVLPRLLDTLQRPVGLALGLGGTALLTVAFVLCLHFSVLAFAGPETRVSLVAVAVVFLAGNAIGSAAPTPGGLGAVEAALIGGLTTVVGVPAAVSLPAVLLFRVLTFWFPVLPGWGAFSYLQRREAV
ncbi:lysylphosphatidylglycerol synthase transmembrane domain-containing protein [Nocardiopsis sp. FIRDI 009]|uniref:lysylphosphatidylglycerol synthase transmembrane domain-containing protein n=1 Tax=Nocardiopsis sp. FIRDI 009 TaxID=714197 RepID=UPI000E2591F0|nr:lysylphosphatidylglycerol synthase transmembrane domain-containing protein [Nocardiopsis sp. FIRDI 009]